MKKRIILLAVVVVIGVAGSLYGRTAWDRLMSLFQNGEEDPVPTLRLHKKDYTVTVTAFGEMTGLKTEAVTAPMVRWEGSMKVAEAAEEGTIVEPGAILVRIDSTAATQSLVQNRNTVQSFDHQISRSGTDSGSEAKIMAFDHDMAQNGVDYADNHVRRDRDIFSKWEIQESILNAALARYKLGNLSEKGSIRKDLSTADLSILNIQRKKAATKVATVEEALSSMEVKAPIGGVIFHMQGWMSKLKRGSEVWPGQPLMEIASLNQFQGKINVLETDITGVTEGKKIRAVLESMPETPIAGKISKIGRVAETLSEEDPRKFFTCEVTWDIKPEMLTRLKPGMKFRAEIEVSHQNAAFVVPRCAVIKKESAFVAFVKGGPKGYTERPVTIRDSDHGFYVIEGVRDGEEICLRHPFEKQKLRLPNFNAPSGTSSRRISIFIG